MQKQPPKERSPASLFLYQTEALLLAVLVLAAVFVLATITDSTSECFMELHTAIFGVAVLLATQVGFVAASAFHREGVSETHKSIGHAAMAAVSVALIVYFTREKANTACVAVLTSGYAVIVSIPMLIVSFVSTPITESPPVVFTREGAFLAGTTVATIAPSDDAPVSRIALGIIVPIMCVAIFSATSSALVWSRANQWFDMIPQCLMIVLIGVYTLLAFLKMHPFKSLNDAQWWTVLALVGGSFALCLVYLVASILRIQRRDDAPGPKAPENGESETDAKTPTDEGDNHNDDVEAPSAPPLPPMDMSHIIISGNGNGTTTRRRFL